MRNITAIFRRDVKNLITRFFPIMIAIGVCILPSLYAWFNIYSNWDPYGSTSNIKIAVANLDAGYSEDGGSVINIGDSVIEGLKENDNIGWVFTETRKQTVEGVKSGEYYAAIVIDKDFSKVVYNILEQDFRNPTITYYENEKKNAVATKITDKAVEAVRSNINKQFISVVTNEIFQGTNELSQKLQNNNELNQFIADLENASANLDSYNQVIDGLVAANQELSRNMGDIKQEIPNMSGRMDAANGSAAEAQQNLQDTTAVLEDFNRTMDTSLTNIENSINKITEDINYVGIDNVRINDKIKADVDNLSSRLKTMNNAILEINPGDTSSSANMTEATGKDAAAAQKTVEQMAAQTGALKRSLKTLPSYDDIQSRLPSLEPATPSVEELEKYRDIVRALHDMYNNQLVPETDKVMESLSVALDDLSGLTDDMQTLTNSMTGIFEGIEKTADATNRSLEDTRVIVKNLNSRISDIIELLKGTEDSKTMQALIRLLGGDPETYGEYFSNPVEVSTTAVYPVDNYGSAVAPFYTVLALWVGGIILVAILKVHANPQDLINIRPYQLFFGRYLIFFVMGQAQATIVALGNIFVLHCQVEHMWLYFLTASLTSFTFTLLIYAFTISFGDIGKAIVVVIMVIQIAGSGGTYPIEILPNFYQKIYLFFPFPYAIGAFRETIAGMYQFDYLIYISKLLLFAFGALLLGMFIRIPFIGISHFIEKRMKDTGMM